MCDPRSSPFASFLYNDTDGTKYPMDWFGTNKDLREEEYFSYSYIMEYLKEKYPIMYKEIDEMFNAFAIMERVRREGGDFYKYHMPSLTPSVYRDMYIGLKYRGYGMICETLEGKWGDFVEWCEMDDDIINHLTFKRDDDYENMIIISWDYKKQNVDRYMTRMYLRPDETHNPILNKIISYYPPAEKGNILFKQNADGCFYATLVPHDSYTISYKKCGDKYVFTPFKPTIVD